MKRNLKNQKGSVILVVLMILIVVTFFGISANNTTNTGLKISKNQFDMNKSFYEAETCSTQALANVMNVSGYMMSEDLQKDPTDSSRRFKWLHKYDSINFSNITDSSYWDDSFSSEINTKCRFLVVYRQDLYDNNSGFSRIMTGQNIMKANKFTLVIKSNNNEFIEIGFIKNLPNLYP